MSSNTRQTLVTCFDFPSFLHKPFLDVGRSILQPGCFWLRYLIMVQSNYNFTLSLSRVGIRGYMVRAVLCHITWLHVPCIYATLSHVSTCVVILCWVQLRDSHTRTQVFVTLFEFLYT